MNKRGVTIIELLISISIIAIIILLLLKVMLSLDNINNDSSYASSDEIARTTIIKNIETDFLQNKLIGLNITNTKESTTINFNYENSNNSLVINKDKITYNNEVYTLKSNNATYNLCPSINYEEIDPNYYLLTITIPVLINKENTTINDDLVLTYLGLKKAINNYDLSFTCIK